MSLFVVVSRNKRSGQEYIADRQPEGYRELSHARTDAEHVQAAEGDDFDVYIGRVVPTDGI